MTDANPDQPDPKDVRISDLHDAVRTVARWEEEREWTLRRLRNIERAHALARRELVDTIPKVLPDGPGYEPEGFHYQYIVGDYLVTINEDWWDFDVDRENAVTIEHHRDILRLPLYGSPTERS